MKFPQMSEVSPFAWEITEHQNDITDRCVTTLQYGAPDWAIFGRRLEFRKVQRLTVNNAHICKNMEASGSDRSAGISSWLIIM